MPTHSARLIWITPNAQDVMAYCARVSNPSNQDNTATAPRLLKYCHDHGHWSVFEMATMCLEINTTRAISPQILRHRSFSFQEFSQRYAEVERPEIPEWRTGDKTNRQSSHDTLSPYEKHSWDYRVGEIYSRLYLLYGDMLEAGIAKECARMILPLSSPTRLYMSGTIRSWIHYTDVRCKEGVQKEHRDIALKARDILHQQIPVLKQL